jgi:hypothetical protein
MQAIDSEDLVVQAKACLIPDSRPRNPIINLNYDEVYCLAKHHRAECVRK